MQVIDQCTVYLEVCVDFIIVCFMFLLSALIEWLPKSNSEQAVLDSRAPEFGVGVALSPSYGTVVVRYANGSFQNIVQVVGKPDYAKAIRRLSTEEARNPRYDHPTLADRFYDEPRLLWRTLRKKAGLPATKDVKILGDLILALKKEAEARLGTELKAALLATPDVRALYEEDAIDAMQYAGLIPLGRAHRLSFNLREINTAYVGYGNGLADYYKDPHMKRTTPIPTDNVLFVELTNKCLLLDRDSFRSPGRRPNHEPRDAQINYALGSEHEDQPQYWDKIRDYIRDTIERARPLERDFSKVLIVGEGASNRLQDVVVEIVRERGNPDVYMEEPTYITARGAAELAWRSLIVMRSMDNNDPYRFTSDEEAKVFLSRERMATV